MAAAKPSKKIEDLVGDERRGGVAGALGGTTEFFSEFWYFLKTSKKWWLLPIVTVFIGLSVFILLTESAVVAPFIYALF
jgi:hypothetical protein